MISSPSLVIEVYLGVCGEPYQRVWSGSAVVFVGKLYFPSFWKPLNGRRAFEGFGGVGLGLGSCLH